MRKALIAGIFLVLATIVVAGAFLPEGKAKEKARMPYIIHSTDPALKTSLKVRHTFPKAFTADLTAEEVEKLRQLGIKVERVKLYHILAPPDKCGDGICQPFESPETCPDDCGSENGGDSNERTCLPSDQTPWGIEKIYNDSTITITTGGEGVDVAVLDTGVYKDHPDLKNRIKQCVDFTIGGPFKTRIKDGSCDDGHGHGTHVAGTIAADGGADGLGIYGIAPQANIFAYKVCDNSGSCWADDIAAAIRYATDNEAEIISMSLGSDEESSLIRDAIDYAVSHGVLVVAAAGNDGPAEGSIDYPAANVNVIAVGAIDVYENVPDWSSRGINDGDYTIEEREIEFGAPGVSIESTWNDGCYAILDGTSMATPHVSGLAAKVWANVTDLNEDGYVNGEDVRIYLHGLARDIWTEGDDPATGFGLPSVK